MTTRTQIIWTRCLGLAAGAALAVGYVASGKTSPQPGSLPDPAPISAQATPDPEDDRDGR